jgi:hypothetical protein
MPNTIDSSIITLVSVITAGLVSVLGVLVPVLTDLWKAKRQQKPSQAHEIDKTALDLLGKITPLRHTDYNKVGHSAEQDPFKHQSDLQASHYAWECAVWHHLNDNSKARTNKLRKIFETTQNLSEYTKQMQELSDEILAITYIANCRV